VLGGFEPDEAPGMASAIARAADAVQLWTTEGLAPMMNVFNRADTDPAR
jgi:hypothetical protein